jgi:hypothetical protein
MMITERLQQVIDEVAKLSPEEQDRVAAAMQVILGQPAPQLSPEWRAAVERAMREQAETLEYLQDK